MHPWLALLGSIGIAGQLVLLSAIAGSGTAKAGLVAALAFLVGAPLARGLRPAQSRMLAMLGSSGLGMTLGGWADLGFRSARDAALQTGPGLDAFWCGSALSGSGGVPGLGHLLSWMNVGMLMFWIPIAALRPRPASLLGCAVGMLLGMNAGSWLAGSLAAALDPTRAVFTGYALMSLGMLVGMLAQERLSRAWRTSRRRPRSPDRRARGSGTLDLGGSDDRIPGRFREGTRSVRDAASGVTATAGR